MNFGVVGTIIYWVAHRFNNFTLQGMLVGNYYIARNNNHWSLAAKFFGKVKHYICLACSSLIDNCQSPCLWLFLVQRSNHLTIPDLYLLFGLALHIKRWIILPTILVILSLALFMASSKETLPIMVFYLYTEHALPNPLLACIQSVGKLKYAYDSYFPPIKILSFRLPLSLLVWVNRTIRAKDKHFWREALYRVNFFKISLKLSRPACACTNAILECAYSSV